MTAAWSAAFHSALPTTPTRSTATAPRAPVWPIPSGSSTNRSCPPSGLFRFRRERDRGFAGQHQERKRLLQIELDRACRVAEIADRQVLPDGELKITATGREHD